MLVKKILPDSINLNVKEIEDLLPHRAPFLFIKSATINSLTSINGVARWMDNNPIFLGHFPNIPIVPGVCLVEAAAQLAAILANFNKKEQKKSEFDSVQKEEMGVLTSIKKTIIHNPVFPNMDVQYEVIMRRVLEGIYSVEAKARIKERKIISSEFTFTEASLLKIKEYN